jgi:predicted nucleic acid-binding protein
MGCSALVALRVPKRARRLYPRKSTDGADAEKAVHRAAGSLLGGEHAIADHSVLRMAAASKCSAYDCEFAALAEAFQTLLITEDKALLTGFPQICRSLSDAIRRGL